MMLSTLLQCCIVIAVQIKLTVVVVVVVSELKEQVSVSLIDGLSISRGK